jgi:hypothetical protein
VGSAVTVVLMGAVCPTAFPMAIMVHRWSWSRPLLWSRHVRHVPTLTISIPATAAVCGEYTVGLAEVSDNSGKADLAVARGHFREVRW